MVADRDLAELLCRVNFPLYNVTLISPRHVMFGGGGGAANTGVHNGFVSISKNVLGPDWYTTNINPSIMFENNYLK